MPPLVQPTLLVDEPKPLDPVQLDVIVGAGQAILIVEDNATLRIGLIATLEMLGYRVLEAANGRQALEICEQHGDRIALVLSDWAMSLMSGLELAHKLEEQNMAIKVLMLTGHSLDAKTKMTMFKNIVDWVLKPFAHGTTDDGRISGIGWWAGDLIYERGGLPKRIDAEMVAGAG